MSYQFVFNQYYIDLIKRIKTSSKKYKESDNIEKNELGKNVYKSIKENYITLDKSSDEYVKFVSNINNDFWDSYKELDSTNANAWFDKEDVKNIQLFNNITIDDVRKLINDDYMCHHFITVFCIFRNELADDKIVNIISLLQGTDKNISIDVIDDENHKKLLQRLHEMRMKKIKENTGIDMKSIEDTTLGKLAKEILEDVDVEKIQKSIGENGDVLKAIGDPDSGFTELITSVSRKMATKISNGELKQENLLQDAMKFASVMPGLFGNKGPDGQGGNAMPDMSEMMKMMGSMMGNKQGMDMFKNMAGNMKGPKGSKPSFNNAAYRKMAAAKKMRAKLQKRKDNEEQN
jgi:hypothetical protein